ncbi:pimeloyl-ACP methyl ester esterase BioH [Methylophilus sp. Q8]|jgi:pimeloyl-[acyl-carrier protein] methyl ester esterase|uniref:pimeloyl-ACP methyl ester esterase BioH n=1 Tax=Methylophilus sp. Q8 TaxID=1506586 RepID=UPI000645E7AB|nr:pimeloyl-ACP methyl ester esterase BioH [Methylophilus sp. Q8]
MSCFIEIMGQGKPLVLLHGWGMNSAVWERVVKRLSANYRLFLVDLPGMGQSRPVYPYHLHSLAEAVAEEIPGVSTILGWSLGGLVAQQIALNQPDRVEKLILVGTNPCFVSKPDWPNGIAARHFEQFNERFEQDFNATLLNFLTLQCMHAKDARSTVRQLRTAFAAKPTPTQDNLNQALDILLQTDLREEVGRLFQPTLLIHGDRDTLAPLSAAHWLAMHMQRAQLRVIAGAAHAPFLSHADAFCESVEAFMADDLTSPPVSS